MMAAFGYTDTAVKLIVICNTRKEVKDYYSTLAGRLLNLPKEVTYAGCNWTEHSNDS